MAVASADALSTPHWAVRVRPDRRQFRWRATARKAAAVGPLESKVASTGLVLRCSVAPAFDVERLPLGVDPGRSLEAAELFAVQKG